jgi:DNA-binding NtrC family response regulator
VGGGRLAQAELNGFEVRFVGQSEASGRIAVLIVEDETLLRSMAVDMVEDAGFEAVEADGTTAAIRILESRLDIRIVFTDINMPDGIDGLALAKLVRDRWPLVAIIITSGMAAPLGSDMPKGGQFFSKPYRVADVIAAMHRMAA